MEKIDNKIGIFILNYNGIYWLKRNLDNIVKHSLNIPIYVIDNNSSDDSLKYLKKKFPTINVHINTKNLGFAKGYNQILLKEKKIKYFIIINNDIEVTENWIEPLLQTIQKENASIVQPKIKALKKSSQNKYIATNKFDYAGAAGGFLDFLGFPFCRGRILKETEIDKGQYNDTIEIFWASGCCFIIESELFHKLNGFDQDLFMHQEEIDLCWRAKGINKKIYYCAESTVYHANGGTLSHTSPIKKYFNHRNNLLIIVKNHQFAIPLILLRLIIDYFIMIIYFLAYNYQSITSFLLEKKVKKVKYGKYIIQIFKAHKSFFLLLPKFLKKRNSIKNNSIYSGFFLFKYFFKP